MPTIVDILALILITICILQGCRRGLSGELAHLIGAIAVFVFGVLAYHPVGSWLDEHTRLEPRAALALAFFATVVLSIVAMILIRLVLKKVIQFVIAERADKLGGFMAGLIKGSVIVVVVFFLMNLWPHDYLNRVFGEKSLIGSVIIRYMPQLSEIVEESKSAIAEKEEKH